MNAILLSSTRIDHSQQKTIKFMWKISCNILVYLDLAQVQNLKFT